MSDCIFCAIVAGDAPAEMVIPHYEDDPLKLPWIARGAELSEIARTGARIRGEA